RVGFDFDAVVFAPVGPARMTELIQLVSSCESRRPFAVSRHRNRCRFFFLCGEVVIEQCRPNDIAEPGRLVLTRDEKTDAARRDAGKLGAEPLDIASMLEQSFSVGKRLLETVCKAGELRMRRHVLAMHLARGTLAQDARSSVPSVLQVRDHEPAHVRGGGVYR